MYRTSKSIKNMTTSNGKQVALGYVKKTNAWERPFLPKITQDMFVDVAEKYKDTLKPETVEVAMKESDSPNDAAQHWSTLEIDKDENVIAVKHYYK
ncbi:hypothetical protein N7468_009920 [Penicillium chermesinum]|uniref:Uncharacterized protein n=1 Tax=Penicillium chermesinum TaxID=63820 RepID=A0A9W9NBP7_9EURO|nr:uncharacterized protein N7468_009920 [Penicillium chermesinum]KAJ5216912.1 hypothetical protein N7468_009920 [Penicillium chermesinum]KAJ6171476.1 hypothetical protein N7470_000543 [Penicillium chermesinum]